MKFYYIYKALAHPENNGYVAPFTIKERLMHVATAKSQFKTKIPWLCDSMDNELKHALGNAPNSEFIIGPDGKIVSANQWSDPQRLREELAGLVGKSETLTSPADLDLGSIRAPKTAAKGIVPRLTLPAAMTAAQVTPIARNSKSGKQEPFYVKLRAEIDQTGEQLYLGFFMDPLHKVHWNNLSEPIEYTITAPKGVTVTPATGKGPDVETPADADPREFLVNIKGRSTEPLKLTVRYFACDDDDRFCKAVTQDYEIVMARDNDGGSRRAAGSRRGPGSGGRGRGGMRGGQARSPQGMGGGRQFGQRSTGRLDPLSRQLDADGDGAISSDEIDKSIAALRKLDTNKDGRVTMDEIREAAGR